MNTGAMNTGDRSIALVYAAMRWPDEDIRGLAYAGGAFSTVMLQAPVPLS